MMCIAGFPFHGYVAMGPMAVNQVTPNQMRAQVSAVYLFTVNLIGLGVGPYLVPMISDSILRDPMQIRWGLLIVVVVSGTIAAALLWRVRATYLLLVAHTAQWHLDGAAGKYRAKLSSAANSTQAVLRCSVSPCFFPRHRSRMRRWKRCHWFVIPRRRAVTSAP
jgi:hypothetical protein